MKIGTRSLLFGVHQFAIHPLMVAYAWTILYGLPLDPRLWVAFVVHDWGYWGKEHMDDEKGETHPELGAAIMSKLFGPAWGDWMLTHSRFYARKMDCPFSQLCVADKLASLITPLPVYWVLASLSGEFREYVDNNKSTREDLEYVQLMAQKPSYWRWLLVLRAYMYKWVVVNRDKGWTVQDFAKQSQSKQPVTISES